MSLQPSLIIWTVICFCLFALVVYRLILKPVLEVMDKREQRVLSARQAAAAAKQKRAEDQKRLAEESRLAAERENALLDERMEARRHEMSLELASLSQEAELRRQKEADGMSERTAEAEREISAAMDGMIAAFTDKLIAGGRG